jgi:uncharacterized protein YqeY
MADFLTAMKEKNAVAKSALSDLKTKITIAEKSEDRADNTVGLTEDEVLKIVTSAIKQRKESIDAFTKGNRPELATKEFGELRVLMTYLPAQMTEDEIEVAIRKIIPTLGGVPQNILGGKCMGVFNKEYRGLANPETVKMVINRIVLQ